MPVYDANNPAHKLITDAVEWNNTTISAGETVFVPANANLFSATQPTLQDITVPQGAVMVLNGSVPTNHTGVKILNSGANLYCRG